MSTLPKELIELLSETTSARSAADLFINWYEEKYVRDKRDFTREIRSLAKPLQHFTCLHLSWSIIVSDGFVEFFETVEEDWFDESACEALHLLGHSSSAEALLRAREVFDRFGEDFPADMDEELYDEFFDPIEDLDLQIGRWLIEEMS